MKKATIIFSSILVVFVLTIVTLLVYTVDLSNKLEAADNVNKELSLQKDNTTQLQQIDLLTQDNTKLRKQLQAIENNNDTKVKEDLLSFLKLFYEREYTTQTAIPKALEAYQNISVFCTETGYQHFAPKEKIASLKDMENMQGDPVESTLQYRSSVQDAKVFYQKMEEDTAAVFAYYCVQNTINPNEAGSTSTKTGYILAMTMRYNAESNLWQCDRIDTDQMVEVMQFNPSATIQ